VNALSARMEAGEFDKDESLIKRANHHWRRSPPTS
jgi:hypothetical protein